MDSFNKNIRSGLVTGLGRNIVPLLCIVGTSTIVSCGPGASTGSLKTAAGEFIAKGGFTVLRPSTGVVNLKSIGSRAYQFDTLWSGRNVTLTVTVQDDAPVYPVPHDQQLIEMLATGDYGSWRGDRAASLLEDGNLKAVGCLRLKLESGPHRELEEYLPVVAYLAKDDNGWAWNFTTEMGGGFYELVHLYNPHFGQ